ncbi:MAG TPA: TRAP transporter small permease [Dehalococcoidia bacterium]|nr:TRAP transporter small permease [Dehalococcoidia bacterium]
MSSVKLNTWIDKLERFNNRLSGWFEWIGIAGFLLMVIITGIDVVGAKVFSWRLLGAIDIVMLSQILAIAFSAAIALIVGRHIRVEFLVNRLPRRTQAIIDSFINLLGLILFLLIIWRLVVLGYSFQTSGEATATIYVPLYPFAYGISLASVPVCLVFLVNLMKSLTKAVGK